MISGDSTIRPSRRSCLRACLFAAMVGAGAAAMGSGGCASGSKQSNGAAAGPAQSQPASDKIGFEEARKMFESHGVQPGQPLPHLSLVDLDGKQASIEAIRAAHPSKPLVLVTCSLTCNVARRRQPDIASLRESLRSPEAGKAAGTDAAPAAEVVMIYVIDAHPKGDPCPYTGKEWVPKDNERDQVLVRQPVKLSERLELARQYRDRFDQPARSSETGGPNEHTIILVDTMDDASWNAIGPAPNLGLLVDKNGIVRLRQGWFEPKAMAEAVKTLTY